jgi:hypothetical protein
VKLILVLTLVWSDSGIDYTSSTVSIILALFFVTIHDGVTLVHLYGVT